MPPEFQSSPDPEAGRNSREQYIWPGFLKFQSSPDPEAGRNGDDDTPFCQRVLGCICADVTFSLFETVWWNRDFFQNPPVCRVSRLARTYRGFGQH